MDRYYSQGLAFILRNFTDSIFKKYLEYLADYDPEKLSVTETVLKDFSVWLYKMTK